MTYPALCPICNCPIQVLYDAKKHKIEGDINDALEAHCRVVHPEQPGPVTE